MGTHRVSNEGGRGMFLGESGIRERPWKTGTIVQNGGTAFWVVSSGDHKSEDKEVVKCKECLGRARHTIS